MISYSSLTDAQINIIYKIPLFRNLPLNIKDSLLERLDYVVVEASRGEIIAKQGTLCNHLTVLLKGELEVNIIDASGNKVKVEKLVAPRAFATPHLFSETNIYPATFFVKENVTLFKATRESFFKLISGEPDVLKSFLAVTGNCNHCTVTRLRILSFKGIRTRFVYYLLENRKNENTSVLLHNQVELAEYLGVSRPALSKEINNLVKEGLISIEKKEVKLLNVGALIKEL